MLLVDKTSNHPLLRIRISFVDRLQRDYLLTDESSCQFLVSRIGIDHL